MRQLTTTKATLLVVKVPSDIESYYLCFESTRLVFGSYDTTFPRTVGGEVFIDLPKGKKKILGLPNEISEEVWSELMEITFDTPKMYKDYLAPTKFGTDMPGMSATESAKSLFQANGLNWENPYDIPTEPWFDDTYLDESGDERFAGEMQSYRDNLLDYQVAEQNSGPFLVLKLIE